MSNNPRIQIVREHLNLKKNNENPSLKDQMKALERTRYGRLRAKQKVVDGICSTHSPDKLLKQMSYGFKIDRIRHTTTLKLNDKFPDRLQFD